MGKDKLEMGFRTLSVGASGDFHHLWQSFVMPHKYACAGHLSANFAVAEAAGSRNRSILLVDEKDRPVAALPLFEIHQTQLGMFSKRLVSSGHDFPAQPLIDAEKEGRREREILDQIVRAVESTAADCGADEVCISYPPVFGGTSAVNRYGYFPLRRYGFVERNLVTLLMDLRSKVEELQRGIEKRCRTAIRRAQGEGCSVREVRELSEWMDCLELARQTLGASAPSDRLHRAHWDHLLAPGHATATVVTPPCSATPSNVVVTIGWNGNWYYWKSYNARQRPVPGMNNLGLWSAIESAKNRNGSFFELGSLEFEDPKQVAIAEFKRSFGGSPTYLLRGVRSRRPVKQAALDLALAAYRAFTRK